MLDQTRWLRVSVVLFSVCVLPGFLGMESVDGGLPEALPIPREWSLSRNQQHPFSIGDREVGAVE
jgi:hypothetical protein